jgi:UDP-glucose-4-epimerase GalE
MERLPDPEPPEDGSDPAAARAPRPLPVPAAPVLVTGGAGSIGACCVRVLERLGVEVVVLDNLSTGQRASVRGPFAEVDLGDRAALTRVFTDHRPIAVVHFAARCYVGESVTEPATYYRENVLNTWNLLEVMRGHGCRDIVFSSTCATYGEPRQVPIPVDHPQVPINPYGRTKLHVEHMLQDYARAYGLRTAALRYFNAAGAMPEEGLGEEHDPETHIIPLVLQVALGRRRSLSVFGGDWPTRDGTCVRDYVHVEDLADAHVRALVKLQEGATAIATNLGTGRGYTVKELVVLARRLTGKEIPAEVVGRRPGDPAQLVADGAHAREVLGWIPRRSSLEQIVRDAWTYATRPDGPHGLGATLAPGERAPAPRATEGSGTA